MDKRKTNSGRTEGSKSDLLTKEEMDKLFSVIADDIYFKTLYTVLKYSGRRIGEIYGTYINKELYGGVKLEDIEFENFRMKTIILKNKKIKVKRLCTVCQNNSKDSKEVFCKKCGAKLPELKESDNRKIEFSERYVPMRDEVVSILKLYISSQNPKFKSKDYIFRTKSLKQIQKKILIHVKAAGIKKRFTIHGFRHYFISNAIKSGLSESQIIKWTGHVDINSLTNYNQLVPNDIRDKVNNIIL